MFAKNGCHKIVPIDPLVGEGIESLEGGGGRLHSLNLPLPKFMHHFKALKGLRK